MYIPTVWQLADLDICCLHTTAPPPHTGKTTAHTPPIHEKQTICIVTFVNIQWFQLFINDKRMCHL